MSSSISLKDFLIPILSAVLSAIFSYFVSRKTVNDRLNRTFLNDDIKEICRRIEKLESKASSYWRQEGQNCDLEDLIKSNFRYLGQDLRQLPQSQYIHYGIERKLIRFRMISTGGLFETSYKKAEPDRIEKIRKAAENLREAVIKIT